MSTRIVGMPSGAGIPTPPLGHAATGLRYPAQDFGRTPQGLPRILDKRTEPGSHSMHDKVTTGYVVPPKTDGGTDELDVDQFVWAVVTPPELDGDNGNKAVGGRVDLVNIYQLEERLRQSHRLELQFDNSVDAVSQVYDARVAYTGIGKRSASERTQSEKLRNVTAGLYVKSAADIANRYSFMGIVASTGDGTPAPVRYGDRVSRRGIGRHVEVSRMGVHQIKNLWGPNIQPGDVVGFLIAREYSMREDEPNVDFEKLGPYQIYPVVNCNERYPWILSGNKAVVTFSKALEYHGLAPRQVAGGKDPKAAALQQDRLKSMDYTSATIGTPYSGPANFVTSQESLSRSPNTPRDVGQFNLRVHPYTDSKGQPAHRLSKQLEISNYIRVGTVLFIKGDNNDPGIGARAPTEEGIRGYEQTAQNYIELFLGV